MNNEIFTMDVIMDPYFIMNDKIFLILNFKENSCFIKIDIVDKISIQVLYKNTENIPNDICTIFNGQDILKVINEYHNTIFNLDITKTKSPTSNEDNSLKTIKNQIFNENNDYINTKQLSINCHNLRDVGSDSKTIHNKPIDKEQQSNYYEKIYNHLFINGCIINNKITINFIIDIINVFLKLLSNIRKINFIAPHYDSSCENKINFIISTDKYNHDNICNDNANIYKLLENVFEMENNKYQFIKKVKNFVFVKCV